MNIATRVASEAAPKFYERLVTKLRVALFIDSDVFAGTERHILDLAQALKQEGAIVSIACPAASPLVQMAKGVAIIRIEKRGLLDLRAVKKLRALLAAGEIDVVHAHNGRTALIAAIARRLAGKGTVFATQHFIEPAHTTRRGWRASLSRAAHRWVQSNTECFIAVSKAAANAMRQRGELDAKLTVIGNGISEPDRDKLTPTEEIRRCFNVPMDAPLIVCAARLEPEKDVATLIDAMRIVAAEIPRARCVIAGEGSQRALLEEQISESNLEEHVTLAGFREDVLSLIAAADIFVLPSLAEPFGLVLLEAMALGKPVIATAAGGPLEIVIPLETGLLVRPSDAAEFSAAILKLLGDADLRASMGSKSVTHFKQRFTARTMASATMRAYSEAVFSSNK